MIVGLTDNKVITLFDDTFTVEQLATFLPKDVIPMEAPDNVGIGWTYSDEDWVPLEIKGSIYDVRDQRYYQFNEYRQILHERTSNDTLQALRKIREKNTDIDWNAWLKTLDEYNLAIDATKLQENPKYPNYPIKPTQ